MSTQNSDKIEKTKFKWTKQANFFAERGNFNPEEIKECEKWIEENLFIVSGGAVLDYLNYKFKN
jgi:hypothetical protein